MEQQLRQQQQANKKMEIKLQGFADSEKEWETDPFAAAQKRGLNAHEWVSKQLGMEDILPEEDAGEVALERLEQLEEREQERAEQETLLTQQTRHAEIRGHVGKFLEDNEFNAVRSSPAAVEKLTQRVRQMEVDGEFAGMTPEQINQTLTTMTTQTDQSLRNEVSAYLQAPGVIKTLLGDETTAKAFREALGMPQPSAGTPPPAGNGAGNEPRTITERLASEPGSREVSGSGDSPLSQRDRERAAVVALERAFARQKAG
ncbi:MAG: hypothetical protein O7B23_10795 [Deltaproteobacteria bacterium]|nr:hypothetical protein [Deltaproteobacteria bacterium]